MVPSKRQPLMEMDCSLGKIPNSLQVFVTYASTKLNIQIQSNQVRAVLNDCNETLVGNWFTIAKDKLFQQMAFFGHLDSPQWKEHLTKRVTRRGTETKLVHSSQTKLALLNPGRNHVAMFFSSLCMDGGACFCKLDCATSFSREDAVKKKIWGEEPIPA